MRIDICVMSVVMANKKPFIKTDVGLRMRRMMCCHLFAWCGHTRDLNETSRGDETSRTWWTFGP